MVIRSQKPSLSSCVLEVGHLSLLVVPIQIMIGLLLHERLIPEFFDETLLAILSHPLAHKENTFIFQRPSDTH